MGGRRGEECADKHFRIPDVRTSLVKPKASSCLPRVSEVLFVVGTKNEKMAVLRIYLTCVLAFSLILTVSVRHVNYRATNFNPPIITVSASARSVDTVWCPLNSSHNGTPVADFMILVP